MYEVPELGVGMVGYGFIGKVHTYAYVNLPLFYDPAPCTIKLVGVCTAHEESARKAQGQAGYALACTDYRELIERDDVHIINCCTPNHLHRDLLMDALQAGKHVYCDKPLALNLAEARQICDAAPHAAGKHQMTFEYRFIPAILRAKQLVSEGFLGDLLSFRALYLHAGYVDPQRPLSWRLSMEKSGGGAVVDLGAHIIDLVRHLAGDFRSVSAVTRTYVKDRPVAKGAAERQAVDVDDIALIQAELTNGAIGTLEVSRLATGTNDEFRLEFHGTKGAIRFNSMAPNWLEAFDNTQPDVPLGGQRGFKLIEAVQRYPKPAVLPGPKFTIGWMRYHIASTHDFLTHIVENTPSSPDFVDGLRVHQVIDAAQESSRLGVWQEVGG